MGNSQKNTFKLLLFLAIWTFFAITMIELKNRNLILVSKEKFVDDGEALVYYKAVVDEIKLAEQVEEELPSLPIVHWMKKKPQNKGRAKCGRYPHILDIHHNNIYWQTSHTSNGTFELFGAYYDVRNRSRNNPVVRILGMINRYKPKVETFCQLWFDGQIEPVTVKTYEYRYIWIPQWGNGSRYQPYLIGCKIPELFQKLVPVSVSLVEKECDIAKNNLKVFYNLPDDGHKKGFAVCVKGLDLFHDDSSVKLIEWIEMITLLGADKIYFYELNVHPNISKVLNYYEKEGKVHVTPLTLPFDQPNVPGLQHLFIVGDIAQKRKSELIPYNDCFYKNMYKYEYIVLLDIDEVIMPTSKDDFSWHTLMAKVKAKEKKSNETAHASYNARQIIFFNEDRNYTEWAPDIPKYMFMLQHTSRAANFTVQNSAPKCFHNTERVLTLHNHFPFSCLDDPCNNHIIDTEDAQLNHYKPNTRKLKNATISKDVYEDHFKDQTIWKFKDQLIAASTKTLKALNFLKNSKNSNILEYE